MNAQASAAKILENILCKKTSLASVRPTTPKIQELCYGTLRWFFQLDYLAKQLLQKKISHKNQDVYVLILIGIYQIMHMRTPTHAAVSETVQAAKSLKKRWAANFVNAILRNFLRQQEKLIASLEKNLSAQYAHPDWLINAIKKNYPQKWEDILTENNARPPMHIRVNCLYHTPKEYLEKLSALNISAKLHPVCTDCITLDKPCKVDDLPGFSSGEISIQDGGAQLAAPLLDLAKGQRVLDACAAPGGKMLHILEIEPELSALVATDHDAHRLSRVKENLQRTQSQLRIQPTLIHGDAEDTQTWWDQKPFDRILLDAPCSGTGVIRRHPDIKLLKTPADIKTLAKKQLSLLNALWPLLKPQGKLLYATCSILPEENQHVITHFLEKNDDAKQIYTKQTLPGEYNMDGFFYALLEKKLR